MIITINLGDVNLRFSEDEIKDYLSKKGYELKDLNKHNGVYSAIRTCVILENADEYYIDFFKKIAIKELQLKLKTSLLNF